MVQVLSSWVHSYQFERDETKGVTVDGIEMGENAQPDYRYQSTQGLSLSEFGEHLLHISHVVPLGSGTLWIFETPGQSGRNKGKTSLF